MSSICDHVKHLRDRVYCSLSATQLHRLHTNPWFCAQQHWLCVPCSGIPLGDDYSDLYHDLEKEKHGCKCGTCDYWFYMDCIAARVAVSTCSLCGLSNSKADKWVSSLPIHTLTPCSCKWCHAKSLPGYRNTLMYLRQWDSSDGFVSVDDWDWLGKNNLLHF